RRRRVLRSAGGISAGEKPECGSAGPFRGGTENRSWQAQRRHHRGAAGWQLRRAAGFRRPAFDRNFQLGLSARSRPQLCSLLAGLSRRTRGQEFDARSAFATTKALTSFREARLRELLGKHDPLGYPAALADSTGVLAVANACANTSSGERRFGASGDAHTASAKQMRLHWARARIVPEFGPMVFGRAGAC